jgi:hypothetical protein
MRLEMALGYAKSFNKGLTLCYHALLPIGSENLNSMRATSPRSRDT